MTSTYATESITESDTRSGFRSGVHALDDYLARHAVGNTTQGIGKTFVLRGTGEEPAVLGYYTLSMAELKADNLADVLKMRLPRYPLPVALIGRLAVHQDAQGRGVGAQLLGDALRRVVDAAAHIGCVGVIVDAKDAKAEAFYRKFAFTALADNGWPRRMFLPIKVLLAAQ